MPWLALLIILSTARSVPAWREPSLTAELHIPASVLPPGCALATTPPDLVSPPNPLAAADTATRLYVRGRMLPADVPTPDGPPFSRAEMQRFTARLVETIRDAYAASYRGGDQQQVEVLALRFGDAATARAFAASLPTRVNATTFTREPAIVVRLEGRGACMDAIAARLRGSKL
jgi:hypothetical protein